jgi:hypothetical protein
MTEDANSLIRRLVPIADRAVAYRTLCYRFLDARQVRTFVDDAGGQ